MATLKTVKTKAMAKRRSVQKHKRFIRTMRAKAVVSKIGRKRKQLFEANMAKPSLLDSIPSDVISEVLARVASSSIPDLVRCKLSCKTFDEIGKEKFVIRQAGMEELNSSPLFKYGNRDAALAFFQRCIDSNNSEAFFQLGMYQYFSNVELEEGIRNLERAANSGHNVAAYVLGLILRCSGSEDEKHKGITLINCVKDCAGRKIVDCRIRLQEFLSRIWLNNKLNCQWKPISCAKEQPQKHGQCRRRCPWVEDYYLAEDDDDDLFCDPCSCEYESKFFQSLFR